MIQQVTQAAQTANDVIDHIASKLSVPAAHLWEILVRQQRVNAIQDVVTIVFTAAVAIAVWKMYPRMRAWADVDKRFGDREVGMAFYYVARGIVLVVGPIIVAVNLAQLIGMWVNPEYYALSTILDAIKPK